MHRVKQLHEVKQMHEVKQKHEADMNTKNTNVIRSKLDEKSYARQFTADYVLQCNIL